jgi:hypothetical protein
MPATRTLPGASGSAGPATYLENASTKQSLRHLSDIAAKGNAGSRLTRCSRGDSDQPAQSCYFHCVSSHAARFCNQAFIELIWAAQVESVGVSK